MTSIYYRKSCLIIMIKQYLVDVRGLTSCAYAATQHTAPVWCRTTAVLFKTDLVLGRRANSVPRNLFGNTSGCRVVPVATTRTHTSIYNCIVFAITSYSLCRHETPNRILLNPVKTQMKCCMMRYFIRVYTVCKGKKDLQTTLFETKNPNLTPLDICNGPSHTFV